MIVSRSKACYWNVSVNRGGIPFYLWPKNYFMFFQAFIQNARMGLWHQHSSIFAVNNDKMFQKGKLFLLVNNFLCWFLLGFFYLQEIIEERASQIPLPSLFTVLIFAAIIIVLLLIYLITTGGLFVTEKYQRRRGERHIEQNEVLTIRIFKWCAFLYYNDFFCLL